MSALALYCCDLLLAAQAVRCRICNNAQSLDDCSRSVECDKTEVSKISRLLEQNRTFDINQMVGNCHKHQDILELLYRKSKLSASWLGSSLTAIL